MQIPEQPYRWLVSLKIIPNQGQMNDKGLVLLPTSIGNHLQSGFNIGQTMKSILKRSGHSIPVCLDNVKQQGNKNNRTNNWNFIWLAFDDLRMQFDPRIKDLILQGENSLIVQIIKQLCDRDEKKNESSMNKIQIKSKATQKLEKQQKLEKPAKTKSKGNTLDIKKMNPHKNPSQSQSSLQFLILLLSSSLNMNIQQILGLFTNQSKYLAHIIVKGINEDFGGIILFYTLLNKHVDKIKEFVEVDKKDAESCLFAIKAGFMSKNQKVTQLTVQIFHKIGNLYDWAVGEGSKGSTTIFLGMKRHPMLVENLWVLLEEIIRDKQVQFFSKHFKPSFKDSKQMIEVCHILIKSVSQSKIKQKILPVGIFSEWIQIAASMFQGPLEGQLVSLSFIGQIMMFLPDVMSKNQDCLSVFSKGWKGRKNVEFVTFVNEILSILDKLAENRSQYARRIYQIIIEIFTEIFDDSIKKQYLVQNFSLLIPLYPKMPSQYFITAYSKNSFDPTDFDLIRTAISINEDIQGLSKIGEILLKVFNSNAVINSYVGPLIKETGKKIVNDEIGQAFIHKAIKDCLYSNSIIQTHRKSNQTGKPQPLYFGQKGNSQKVTDEEIVSYKIKEKESFNLLQLVQELCQIAKSLGQENYFTKIKQELLNSSSFIKKNNFKVSSKGISGLLKKFNISKEDQQQFDEQYKNKTSLANMEQSLARKKSFPSALLTSKVSAAPEHIQKQFNQIYEKRKKEELSKKAEEQKKQKQQAQKMLQVKKQMQRQQLIRGFGSGQAELKEEGFWSKLIKQDNKQLQLYPPSLMEVIDTQSIENLFKKYQRITRHFFTKYSSSMYTVKSMNNFDDNMARKETLNLVEVIKFLKDYKLFFLTNSNEVQNLIRDINIKLINKRETQELDFVGFENFLVQFSATSFTKSHTINTKTAKGIENVRRNLSHMCHGQLLQELFNYIKLVFQQKGEKTAIFDEPESVYFNESDVIKQFNRKVKEDPSFILPEGYKKITQKVINLVPEVSNQIKTNISESLFEVFEILDQIIFQSSLNFHIMEPMSKILVKTRVKPFTFGNIKPKLLSTPGQGKTRALSSANEKKSLIAIPQKMLQRKVLSFGMKLGLSYVNYKDKLLGQQVAYVIDDMITAVENGRTTIEKQKIVNDVLKRKSMASDMQRKLQAEKQKKRRTRKQELQKIKKQEQERKKNMEIQQKNGKDKKKEEQTQKQKKKKQEMQKYLLQQKTKIKQKKAKQQQQKINQQQQNKNKKQQNRKAQSKFKEFNQKQIQKLQKGAQQANDQKKKNEENTEEEKKKKQEMFKKLRTKINSQDRKFVEIRQKNNEQIRELFSSPEISQVFSQFQINLRAIFDFLIRSTHLSLTERKHNNQIISQTWNYFTLAFQLNPLIINSKNVTNIFKSLTRDKQGNKDFHIGLNYNQFEQALLRIAIKHKTVFNKVAQKIKQGSMSQSQIDAVIDKDIEEKQKNQFDEQKQIDVKGLLIEDDINKDVHDDYGEIKKVTPKTLKGLIYYLCVPQDKAGQEARFRQITTQKNVYVQKHQKLKEKLKEQYSLGSPLRKKKNQQKPFKPKQTNEQQQAKEDSQQVDVGEAEQN